MEPLLVRDLEDAVGQQLRAEAAPQGSLKSYLLEMPGADVDDSFFERVAEVPRPLPDLAD